MGSLLVFWPHSVFGQNHLCIKDTVNRDSTCQSIFRRLCTAKNIEDFIFPVSRPDNVLSHPDAHLSTVPFIRTTCYPIRTPICPLFHSSGRRVIPSGRQTNQHHPSGRRIFPCGPSTVSRSFCSSLHPSGPLSIPSRRPSVIDQLQILSKFRYGKIDTPSGRCGFPSGRAHQLRKLLIRLQPSGCLPLMVRTHA
jgi:hypothetical protein